MVATTTTMMMMENKTRGKNIFRGGEVGDEIGRQPWAGERKRERGRKRGTNE